MTFYWKLHLSGTCQTCWVTDIGLFLTDWLTVNVRDDGVTCARLYPSAGGRSRCLWGRAGYPGMARVPGWDPSLICPGAIIDVLCPRGSAIFLGFSPFPKSEQTAVLHGLLGASRFEVVLRQRQVASHVLRGCAEKRNHRPGDRRLGLLVAQPHLTWGNLGDNDKLLSSIALYKTLL